MNLLLLLTALLTSLTGMMSGDRTGASGVQATAQAGQGGVRTDIAAHAIARVAATRRPEMGGFTLRQAILPLPRALALVPAIRLAAEKRRE